MMNSLIVKKDECLF